MTNSALHTLIWQALELYSVDLLPQFLTDKKVHVRMGAARAIQLKGGEPEFELACSMLKSSTRLDRELGAFILGQLGTPVLPYKKESVPLLEHLLEADRAASVRAIAATALGHLRARESIDTLILAADDSSPDVRSSVASALIRFPKSSKARACLNRLSRDESPSVRYWAGEAD